MKALRQSGVVLKVLLVLVVFAMVPNLAKVADFTSGSNMVSVNLAQGTFTLNGTNYKAARVVLQNGGADIYFKDAADNVILYWRARDGFFRSSVQVRVTVGGQDITFVQYGQGSLGRFLDDLFVAELDVQQQDALSEAVAAALAGDADLMQDNLESVLAGQTEEEPSDPSVLTGQTSADDSTPDGVELAELSPEDGAELAELNELQLACDERFFNILVGPYTNSQVGRATAIDDAKKYWNANVTE